MAGQDDNPEPDTAGAAAQEAFAALVLRHFDGATTPEEDAALRDELAARPDRRDAFVVLARRHGQLAELLGAERAAAPAARPEEGLATAVGSARSSLRLRRRLAGRSRPGPSPAAWAALAAAAVILVLVIAQLVGDRPAPGRPGTGTGVAKQPPAASAEHPADLATAPPKPSVASPVPPPPAVAPAPTPRVETPPIVASSSEPPSPAPPSPVETGPAPVTRLDAPAGAVFIARGTDTLPVTAAADVLAAERVFTRAAPAAFTLPDGARVFLNASTDVAFAKDGDLLRLTVASGEVFVEAPTGTRDLRVTTRDGEAVIQGTSFGVRRGPDGTRVVVEHGRVLVKTPSNESTATTGTLVEAGPAGAGAAKAFDVRQGLCAWRAGVSGAPAAPDPAAVRAAVAKGCGFLTANLDAVLRETQWPDSPKQHRDVLMLYALAKGGVAADDPSLRKALQHALDAPLNTCYQASVLAMALGSIDSKAQARKIRECAQFLADNQSENGQWDYGRPAAGGTPAAAPGTDPVVRPRAKGRPAGDNANTWFAVMGLRACEQAGVRVADDVWQRALACLAKGQRDDGGWSYTGGADEDSSLAVSEGSLAALVLCGQRLRKSWWLDPQVHAAAQFIAQRFSLTDNRFKGRGDPAHQLAHLFALQCAGRIAGLDAFGARRWFDAGAARLLREQGPDGHWYSDKTAGDHAWDTAFAILFLQRATEGVK